MFFILAHILWAFFMPKVAYLVGYDISDPNCQAKYRHAVRQFSVDGQLSAYECWLSLAEKRHLQQLADTLLDELDAVCVIRTGAIYWQNSPKNHPIHTPIPDFLYIG